MEDNEKILLGTSDDLEIFHNGSHSRFLDNGAGKLQFGSDTGFEILTANFATQIALFDTTQILLKENTSVTGNITTTGNVSVPDSSSLICGDSSDLKIFHDGTQSVIENYTGHLIIRGNRDDDDGGNIYIQAKVNENSILCNDDGSVELYFDNSKKAETVTGGFTVTGTCTATDFSGDGSSLTSLNASNIGSGTINTARLPNTYTKAASVTVQATGSGSDLKLDAADHIIFESGEEEDGNIYFRGNGGTDSYRFAKSGQTSIEGFLSFESLSADRTFTFPDTTGTLALTSSDITGNAATATALATARTIGGTSFDGTANITPAECTNADTVDSLHASSFLRSDAADTMSQSTSGTATLTVTNSGGAGSGIGTGAIVAEFNGDSDGVVIRNIAGGDYSIMNDQQNNGFVLYDGTGGVDIVYNGTVRVEFDSGNTYGDFKGTPSVNGTNLALITDVGGGATGGGSDEVFYENDQNVTTDYTITNGKNAMAAGPITIDSGATVTVGSGETLTIV